MDWRDIPSLAALRAFEAAARSGSFSAAARELNVTHAAIAQHVRQMETHLNTALVVRAGRGMALTPAGEQLSTTVSEGFAQIIAGVRATADVAHSRPLALSVTPSFAENWLMPRLSEFWATYPDFGLSIQPSVDVVDLRKDSIDMAIRYGRGSWPGLNATHLIPADFTVIGAPQLLAGHDVTAFSDLSDLPWIFETVHQEARRWVADNGLDMDRAQTNVVPTFGMVMAAVRAGKGLTVASSTLIADEIAEGRLQALMQLQPKGLAYYMVHPKGVLSPKVKLLKSWLQAAAKA